MVRLVNSLTKADAFIILSVFAIAIASIILLNTIVYAGKPDGVVIELNGKLYAKYDFSSINSQKMVEINTEYGYNVIEIQASGKVRVTKASCPDQLDVAMRWINKPNQMLVCLPNRLVVRLVGKPEIDVVSY